MVGQFWLKKKKKNPRWSSINPSVLVLIVAAIDKLSLVSELSDSSPFSVYLSVFKKAAVFVSDVLRTRPGFILLVILIPCFQL